MPVYRYPPTDALMSILTVDNRVGCGQLGFETRWAFSSAAPSLRAWGFLGLVG